MVIVYVSGVFDLFHYGHMEFLANVRSQFPECILIAGVHNDEDVATYKRTPVMTMHERARAIVASKLVDRVILNAPLLETEEFYQQHNIEKTVHAHSEAEHERWRRTFFPHAGDRLVRLDYSPGISTTDLIERILHRVEK